MYGLYVFFSLSSRIPTFCMLLSSISLMAVLGLIAYDRWSAGVLAIAVFVVFVMMLEFVVYGMHRIVTSASRVADLMVSAVQGLRGLAS
jgi:hypothetical protein